MDRRASRLPAGFNKLQWLLVQSQRGLKDALQANCPWPPHLTHDGFCPAPPVPTSTVMPDGHVRPGNTSLSPPFERPMPIALHENAHMIA
jgi:hypothetical protein